jgi:hypothetical protein
MFTIRPFEARTTSWWFAQRDNIDMSPPYQRRGRIWNPDAKAYLIDSILNDFDIPKFYLADFTYTNTPLNATSSQYAVIDGKQRFEAIFDFYTNRVVLKQDFQFFPDPTLSLGGLSYQDLRSQYPKVASRFENFNLSIMSVITDEEAKINELFVRLNASKPLTGPEFRNAMRGMVPGLIRDLSGHPFFKENIAFSTNRGEDRQVAAKLLLVEFRGDLVDTKRAQLDRLVEEGAKAEASATEFNRAAERAQRTLDKMSEVFIPKDPLLRSQGPLVVYYWLVRTLRPEYLVGLREFLVDFEQQRKRNRELAKHSEQSRAVDPELLRFDSLNRSINDIGSLRGRASILLRRYTTELALEDSERETAS